MFTKVLIANRGEIAVRICRTLKAMDVDSIAVYADPDRGSMHVDVATEAYPLGDGNVVETYLNIEKIIDIAQQSGAEAVIPGYGFLSENAAFAQALGDAGIEFVGPRPEHLSSFGLKHKARALAEAAGVRMLPGSGVLSNIEEAVEASDAVGFPLMLKSSAGGGGIGMNLCQDLARLAEQYDGVQRLAASQFGDERLFLERFVRNARHVEVQAFGDGLGGVVILGDRDCSLQRRHQKVVEECPAPNLPDHVRQRMHTDAQALLSSVRYRSAGTVEFLYDAEREESYFLEVNTRLQVEHGITELVFGVDIVQWMLEFAAGELPSIESLQQNLNPKGFAIEVRLCAEDPNRDFQPTPGLLTVAQFPEREDTRVDTWIRSGTEVSPLYDSLIGKVMQYGRTREEARTGLQEALNSSILQGIETNLRYLEQVLGTPEFTSAAHDTSTLGAFDYKPHSIDVLSPGAQTSIQAWPGRLGLWHVGVPPSGPMDDWSFRLGNCSLGNPEGASGLEITVTGPTLRFNSNTTILIAGDIEVSRIRANEEQDLLCWKTIELNRGDVLQLGQVRQGVRAYLLVSGGLKVTEVLGSAATFPLGGIGGVHGRTLVGSEVLHIASQTSVPEAINLCSPERYVELLESRHQLRITLGPHATDEFLTNEDIEAFLDATWIVHYNSSRTGVRLIGPQPTWARTDGGEAGLHPSNIHDNPYAIGAIDFTGDMPVILGPDGPSLGGFVCPAAVIEADSWKLGQLQAGDEVNLVAVTEVQARNLSREKRNPLQSGTLTGLTQFSSKSKSREDPIIAKFGDVCVRRASQDSLLVEFGPNELHIGTRLRVSQLESLIQQSDVDAVQELTAGIRSLLIRFESDDTTGQKLTTFLEPLIEGAQVPPTNVSSRIVHLPLSWDDPACQEAVSRYMQGVREDAPWCPDNIEFIRRINGLPDHQSVKDIVFGAEYLTMGLGDVYLGAPVAIPVDPRHRLVTTKYNPARTWTAENSVGIGGSYLCIYGMEGPGGYQFVGRTVQIWNHYQRGLAFTKPWLLRPFDRIRFFEVDAQQLLDMREAFPRGGLELKISEGTFDYSQHRAFETKYADDISSFRNRRRTAFETELEEWKANGQLTFDADESSQDATNQLAPAEDVLVSSPFSGSIWQVLVESDQQVQTGEVLFVVESMKAEFEVKANTSCKLGEVLVSKGERVSVGQALVLAAAN